MLNQADVKWILIEQLNHNWVTLRQVFWNTMSYYVLLRHNTIANATLPWLSHLSRMRLESIIINSFRLVDAYMRHYNIPALVQIMARRLDRATAWSVPMLNFCELVHWEQISMKFESNCKHLHARKCIWKCRLEKWRPFCPVLYVLNMSIRMTLIS